MLATEGVIIKVADVREIVERSHYAPSVGRHRVIVVEDADRMTEQTSNVLLKELEEPPERTVWILCAPSEADLIPDHPSRVRSVRLQVPSIADVAELLVRRDGVDAGSPSGPRARRRATSAWRTGSPRATRRDGAPRRCGSRSGALRRRRAVAAAARLLEIAGDDAKAITELATPRSASTPCTRSASRRAKPAACAPLQLKALEDDQKRRATRSLRDGIDRILVDLASLYRDILLIQLGAEVELVNLEMLDDIGGPRHPPRRRARSRRSTPSRRHASASRATCSPPSRSRRCSSPRSGPDRTGPHDRRAHSVGRMPRALGMVAAVALGALLVTGCVPVVPRARGSGLDADREKVAADLSPFYTQVLEWELVRRASSAPPPRRRSTGSVRGDGEIELALVRARSPAATRSARCS